MAGIINDHRKKDTRPAKEVKLWAVATDKYLSGWGMAPGTSYIAYPIDNLDYGAARRLLNWMANRGDLKRVRENLSLPRLHDGDHLSLADVPNLD